MSTGAMSVKIVLGLIVVIALGSSSQSFAAPQTLWSGGKIQFTRCDNSTEPLGKIEISACKDQEEFCMFRFGSGVTAEIEFTPEKSHKISTSIAFDFGGAAVGVYACDADGAKCPFEAGVKQHIKAEIPIVKVTQKGNTARLVMTDDFYKSAPNWYCVEMPAKLVR